MSEFDDEFAHIHTPAARASEARKRILRTHVAFVVGALIQFAGFLADGGKRAPTLLELPFILLLGGYIIAAVYLVFPAMWRHSRATDDQSGGLGGYIGGMLAILAIATIVGIFGGGAIRYAKLRKFARADDGHAETLPA